MEVLVWAAYQTLLPFPPSLRSVAVMVPALPSPPPTAPQLMTAARGDSSRPPLPAAAVSSSATPLPLFTIFGWTIRWARRGRARS